MDAVDGGGSQPMGSYADPDSAMHALAGAVRDGIAIALSCGTAREVSTWHIARVAPFMATLT